MQLIIAQSGGVKFGGRHPRLKDFLPKWAWPDSQEEGMAEAERQIALQKQNGKK